MFKVPSEIPWVSATSTILAYVKIDALLLRIGVDYNVLDVAFALENAGISRADITSEPFNNQMLFVRVRPVTVAQVLKIANIVKQQLNPPTYHVYSETAFVQDCNGTIASLSGLALAQAHERARLMAQAAGTSLGEPLGVVDSGGRVVDAVCGFGSDATVQQLMLAERQATNRQGSHGELHASIVRSISAAWRLKLPANPSGEPWYSWGNEPRQAFIADGLRGHGDALLSIVPNRASVIVPEWAYAGLRHSAYAPALKRVSLEMTPLEPLVVVHAKSLTQLVRLVAELQTFVSKLGAPLGKHQDLQAVYSSDDCTSATDAALFRATRNAIAQLAGKPLRYLQQTWLETFGDANCTYEPETDDAWSSVSAPRLGGAGASVVAGY